MSLQEWMGYYRPAARGQNHGRHADHIMQRDMPSVYAGVRPARGFVALVMAHGTIAWRKERRRRVVGAPMCWSVGEKEAIYG